MDIDRAKAVADAAQAIINPAKAEVDQLKHTGGTGTDFTKDKPINGPVSVHKLRG